MSESESQAATASREEPPRFSDRMRHLARRCRPARLLYRVLKSLAGKENEEPVTPPEQDAANPGTGTKTLDDQLASNDEAVQQSHTEPVEDQAVVGRDMQNYGHQVADNYAELSDTFDSYRRLVDGLIEIDRRMIVPACELAEDMAPESSRVALRHDIDADPITALRMARFLASRGVGGTFYLLHTAPYYGDFHNHLFVRQPELVHWIRGFLVAGCELGLHNDAMGASQIPGVNGAACLQQEIGWLRSLGVNVKGTAGHNSLPSYGAENSEVFSGRRLWARSPVTPTGEPLPLEELSEQDLGLTYEGTFAEPRADLDIAEAEAFTLNREDASIRNEQWMRLYLPENPYCRWTVDVQIWIVGRNQWCIGGRLAGRTVFEWDRPLGDVLEFIGSMPSGTRVLFVLHPEYMRL